jgi:8-oxo-dGTP pyrophosphatase MutT (NUDIX family)
MPGGGVEAGETPQEAAFREAHEETGGHPPIPSFGSFHSDGYTTIFCSMDPTDAEMWKPKLSPESDDWGWFDPAAPPAPLRPNVKAVLEHIL